jgi:CDP-diacylglycerol--glycerol-3-phosphate 3-phosphatidyltransferase
MMKKGIAMGARKGGKLKAVLYMIAGATALLARSAGRLGVDFAVQPLIIAAHVIFILSIIVALLSFADYLRYYKSTK